MRADENDPCAGFDPDVNPRALFVGLGNSNEPWTTGSNSVRVHIKRNWENVSFSSSPISIATIDKVYPDGKETILTVTGHTPGAATISAKSRLDDSLLSSLDVDVRARLPIVVELYDVHETSRGTAPQNLPTRAAVMSRLNTIYNRQSNVYFSDPQSSLTFPTRADSTYDLNLDGKLENPAGTIPSSTEWNRLLDDINAAFGQIPDQNFRRMMYVKEIKPSAFGIAQRTSPPGGITFWASVSDLTSTGTGPDYTTAHEIGHTFGLGNVNGTDTGRLMQEGDDNLGHGGGCRLTRDEWRKVNP